MIFSKKTIRTTSIPKIRKIHVSIWELIDKNIQKWLIWPKNGQNFTIVGQNEGQKITKTIFFSNHQSVMQKI